MTRTRLLIVILASVCGIAVPLPAASATTSPTASSAPSSDEAASAVDYQAAQEALADARQALAEAVTQRKAAQVELETSEEAVRTARAAVEDAAGDLEDVSQRLRELERERDRELDTLRLEVRESYKEGKGRALRAATLDLLVLEDDAADAMHRRDALKMVAAKRADKVVALESVSDRIAATKAEQSQLLQNRRDGLAAARQAREARAAAMAVLADLEAGKVAAERAARDLVAELASTGAHESLSPQQMTDLSTLTSSVASLRAVSAKGGVPADLVHYGNGRVPAAALQPIGVGSHRLWGPAAESFASLRAAAERDGITIGVTDSYRSYDAQVILAEKKGLYAEGGLAARPGTSDHGWGLALDLDLNAAALTWMRAHASQYGFVEDTPREPWHWAFTSQS